MNNNITTHVFNGDKKIINFNKLTDEEKKILYLFILIMNKLGYTHLYKLANYGKDGNFCIYKEDNIWKTYIIERNQIFGAKLFDNIYDACMDIFECLDLKSSTYCLEIFPEVIKQNYNIEIVNQYLNPTKKIKKL